MLAKVQPRAPSLTNNSLWVRPPGSYLNMRKGGPDIDFRCYFQSVTLFALRIARSDSKCNYVPLISFIFIRGGADARPPKYAPGTLPLPPLRFSPVPSHYLFAAPLPFIPSSLPVLPCTSFLASHPKIHLRSPHELTSIEAEPDGPEIQKFAHSIVAEKFVKITRPWVFPLPRYTDSASMHAAERLASASDKTIDCRPLIDRPT